MNKETFFSKVMPVPEAGCWLWAGTWGHFNYGNTYHNKRWLNAHRLSWELFRGPIPEGMYVLHKCDIPQCCNPDHLFIGTPSDNNHDCVSKSRHYGPRLPGESNGRARLTAADVIAIRAHHAAHHDYRYLMTKYDMSRGGVNAIVQCRTWKHI